MELKQGAVEDEHGGGEVDDEAGDVDEGGDEGGGGSGGVEAEAFEDEGEHGAGDAAPEDDADEREADGQSDEMPVGAVDCGEGAPEGDATVADGSESQAEECAGGEFAQEDVFPVAEFDFVEGEGAIRSFRRWK